MQDSFPHRADAHFLLIISKVLLLTYAVDALRKVMMLGVDIGAAILPLVLLALLAAMTVPWAPPRSIVQ